MRGYILKKIRGNSDFKACFFMEDGYEYNTFIVHISAITILITMAFLQHDWNFISVSCVCLVVIDMSVISYRLGYADMQRTNSQVKKYE